MNSNLAITKQPDFVDFCSVCGLPLLIDGGCRHYHKSEKKKRGKFSGKSKTPYGSYEER